MKKNMYDKILYEALQTLQQFTDEELLYTYRKTNQLSVYDRTVVKALVKAELKRRGVVIFE